MRGNLHRDRLSFKFRWTELLLANRIFQSQAKEAEKMIMSDATSHDKDEAVDPGLLGWGEVERLTGFSRETIEEMLLRPECYSLPTFPRPEYAANGDFAGWRAKDIAAYVRALEEEVDAELSDYESQTGEKEETERDEGED